MSSKNITLSPDFISILSRKDFDKFTVLELRSAYIALANHGELDKNQAQRLVYRIILKLKNKGLLKRVDSKKTKKTTYVKTDLFFVTTFKPDFRTSEVTDLEPTNSKSCDIAKSLTEKLQLYKAELLLVSGESEEYKELYSEYPQLKNQLQQSYNSARDNSSKLLGRVKAIETLIAQQNETDGAK